MLRFLIARVTTMLAMALLATLVVFLITNTVPGAIQCWRSLAIRRRRILRSSRNGATITAWTDRCGNDISSSWRGSAMAILAAPSIRNVRCWMTSKRYTPATLELATVAFCLTLIVGIPLGILAAVRRDFWIHHLARVVSLLGVSSPTFWLAFILLAVFYGYLQIDRDPDDWIPLHCRRRLSPDFT